MVGRVKKYLSKKLLIKAAGYRLFVILFDLGVVGGVVSSTGNLVMGIVVLNLLKILGYYLYDLLWAYPEARTPLRLIDRVLKLLNSKDNRNGG